MRSYKDLAINSKLTLLVVLSGSVSLLLSCIAFVTNDVRMIRLSMINEMSTLAQVLGSNSTAALSFDDAKTAGELLTSLEEQPDVELACIYDAAGRVFATFHRGDSPLSTPAKPPPVGYEFTASGYLDVTRRIEHDGHTIGTIYLHSSMGKLYDQIFWYINIVAVVMIGSLAASIAISSRLQRAISTPILQLADAAEQVSENNYDIRVSKSADDELGVLYDQFNAMLEQIQQRDVAIQRANDELEAKVEKRTLELSGANQDLKHEIAVRLQAEKKLAATQQQLMTSARRAGMAEIATGVLHNVGNVLNSINVSATLASDRLRQSKINDLARAVGLLEQHRDDLAAFMTSDAKGQQLVPFLELLATHLADERTDILKELELLSSKVDHIKAIVSTQQSYAGVSGVTETVDIVTLLDDAMNLNSASLERHHIHIRRDYAEIPARTARQAKDFADPG